MSLLVKICGLREAEHVDAAVTAGADAIGFVFADSVRKIDPQHAAHLCQRIPPHIQRVAVMRHPDNCAWLNVLRLFSPDVLQTDAQDYALLDVPGAVEKWPVYREGGIAVKNLHTGLSPYVFEGHNSGQGETVNWAAAASVAVDGNMILAGGLAASNIVEAVSTVRPRGVDVSSGVETSRGEKDVALITEFLQAARAAEKYL